MRFGSVVPGCNARFDKPKLAASSALFRNATEPRDDEWSPPGFFFPPEPEPPVGLVRGFDTLTSALPPEAPRRQARASRRAPRATPP